MNWFKKKFEQFSSMLNADEAATNSNKNNKSEEKPLENIEELKEVTINAITKAVRLLGYGNTSIAAITFHSRFTDNAVENHGINALMNDEHFVKQLKRDFKSKGISYNENFAVHFIPNSDKANQLTKIIDGISVEVLSPQLIRKKPKAKIIATEGITWEAEYILEPLQKQYYIGRCKDPKIENGPKIHNDIAFIGLEEKNEEQYKINSYVSRSHALISFDEELDAYKIYRSKFLTNPSHKIKIYNSKKNDFSGVSLNQPTIPHVLKDGDAISLNDMTVLEFSLIHE